MRELTLHQFSVLFKNGMRCTVWAHSLSSAKIEAFRKRGEIDIKKIERIMTYKELST